MTDKNAQSSAHDQRPPSSSRSSEIYTPSKDLLGQALQNLTEEQRRTINAEAASAALELEKKRATYKIELENSKDRIGQHLEMFNKVEKGGRTNRQNVRSNIELSSGDMHIESKSGFTCFVASVAYGDPNHQDVILLRWYRDTILRKYLLGRLFIKGYWIIGPYLATIVNNSDLLKAIFRRGIEWIVSCIRFIYSS